MGHDTDYGYDAYGENQKVRLQYQGRALNRKTSLTLPDPDGADALAAPVYGYCYNAVGSRTTETDLLGNVTTTAYDNLQRRTILT